MADVIYLVAGDERPVLNLTLKDRNSGDPADPETWDPIDLSDPATSVSVRFRAQGSATLQATLASVKIGSGVTGEVFLRWPAGVLDVAPGAYEGEVVISFGADTHTVYETLRFQVRAPFA